MVSPSKTDLRSLILFLTIFCLADWSINLLSGQDTFPGYTFFSPQPSNAPGEGAQIYLLGPADEVVNSWDVEYGSCMNPYLLPDSTVFYLYRVPNPTMNGSGVGGGLLQLDWDGNILWETSIANDSLQLHHDIEPLPNGHILVIAWERKNAAEAYAMGRLELDNPLLEMWSAVIFELEPVSTDGFNIIWEWHLWDHLIQDVDPELTGFGLVEEHPELININYGLAGGIGPMGPVADWIHLNCISYHTELDQIMLTSRAFGEIYIIDHSTSSSEAAGHSGGNSGMGGDILYRWGNPQVYERGSEEDRILSGPHGGVWIDSDFPGGGDLLIFNNGIEWSQSSVLEIVPPVTDNGTYFIAPGVPFEPAEPQWSFTGAFFSPMMSGAFRLPNGNTVITIAVNRFIMEVSPDGNILWQYLFEENGFYIPRAIKYSLDYLTADDVLLGDINGDNQLDILDIVEIVIIILESSPWLACADVNQDGVVDILDVILLVDQILTGR